MPVRLILLAVLFAGAAWLVLGPDKSGRARVTWAVLFSLVLVPTAWMEWRWLTTQAAASRVVEVLSGRPDASAYCQRLSATFFYAGAESGHVTYLDDSTNDDTAWLTYDACQRIRDWRLGDHDADRPELVAAVHVLTHEAVHVRGERSEAVTECTAMQWDARTAGLLGATPDQARALQVAYWERTYPRMPDAYRSPDCREDGPLDLTPGDASWP